MALRYYIQAGGQQVICSWKTGPWMQKKLGKTVLNRGKYSCGHQMILKGVCVDSAGNF
jgi:hypothetical protein